jgi:ribosomal protein S18 acetylase RimI-like enzyme
MLKQVRPLETRDLDAAANAMQKAASRAYAYFGWNHSVADMRQFISEKREIWASSWAAEINGFVQGFMALEEHFVDQLFIAPDWYDYRLGHLLMEKAKTIYPSYLELDCAQQNFRACRFYERQGFVAVKHSIHEKAGIGEITYRWQGK